MTTTVVKAAECYCSIIAPETKLSAMFSFLQAQRLPDFRQMFK